MTCFYSVQLNLKTETGNDNINIEIFISYTSLSIPPENIRKVLVFWCFQGGIERNLWI